MTGTFQKYEISGNDFYQQYNAAMAQLAEADSTREVAREAYMQLLRNEAPREEIMAQFAEVKKVDSVYQSQVVDYVSAHLDSEAALFLLFMNRSGEGENLEGQFA